MLRAMTAYAVAEAAVASALRYASTACTPPAPDCSIPASSPPMVLAALRLRLRVGCSRRGIGIASTPRADGKAKGKSRESPLASLGFGCLAWLVPGAVVVRGGKAIFYRAWQQLFLRAFAGRGGRWSCRNGESDGDRTAGAGDGRGASPSPSPPVIFIFAWRARGEGQWLVRKEKPVRPAHHQRQDSLRRGRLAVDRSRVASYTSYVYST